MLKNQRQNEKRWERESKETVEERDYRLGMYQLTKNSINLSFRGTKES